MAMNRERDRSKKRKRKMGMGWGAHSKSESNNVTRDGHSGWMLETTFGAKEFVPVWAHDDI